MAADVRVVVIVRQEREDLLDILRARLGPNARVILDRRRGERRRATSWRHGLDGGGRLPGDRRRGDRRLPLTAAERKVWEEAGYCLIFVPTDASVAIEAVALTS